MPEHIKDTNKQSDEFNDYLKGFVDARFKENNRNSIQESRSQLREKVRKAAASVAIMLAG